MFRGITLYCSFGFALLFLIWVLCFAVVRQSDIDSYLGHKEQRHNIKSTTSRSVHSSYQRRQGVRKDIWFSEEGKERLHYRIESESSILTLLPQNNKLDIVETLEQIKCWMQDKLYVANGESMQQMRFFEANQGIYRYSTQQFVAQTVALSLYRFPGQDLPQQLDTSSAFLKGLAQNVSFSVAGKTPQFQAQQFKASLKQKDAL